MRWEEGEIPNKEEDAELVADNDFSDLLEEHKLHNLTYVKLRLKPLQC